MTMAEETEGFECLVNEDLEITVSAPKADEDSPVPLAKIPSKSGDSHTTQSVSVAGGEDASHSHASESKSKASSSSVESFKNVVKERKREVIIVGTIVILLILIITLSVMKFSKSKQQQLVAPVKTCFKPNEEISVDFAPELTESLVIPKAGILESGKPVESSVSEYTVYGDAELDENGRHTFSGVAMTGSYKAVLINCSTETDCVALGNSAKFEVSNDCQTLSSAEAAISPTEEATASPTDSPSESPSERPSASPTVTPVPPKIEPIQNVFEYAEDIIVDFDMGNIEPPMANDWVGLFKDADVIDGQPQGEGELFAFTCTDSDGCLATNGTKTFRVTLGGNLEDSVLDSGRYRFFLLRDGASPPYTVLAGSEPFKVSRDPNLLFKVIRGASKDIWDMIRDNPALGPKFVRLGFHDCVGGCDGCVDLTFHDNDGLLEPIEELEWIVEKWENYDGYIFSRADIWALAALEGADHGQLVNDFVVDFSLDWVGRRNCEFDGPCFDAEGEQRECSSMLGPHRELPMPNLVTSELFHFFDEEFGFSVQETVALMGAHTLGALARENSGFDGPNGWVRDNTRLDNDYYIELVGGSSFDDSTENWIELAPPWTRVIESNGDLDDIPDRFMWEAFPPSSTFPNGERILMLNADVALVRDFEGLIDSDGVVDCGFINSVIPPNSGMSRCPHAEMSLEFAAEYRFDNDKWVEDFHDVYKKMLNHGFEKGTELCRVRTWTECWGGQ